MSTEPGEIPALFLPRGRRGAKGPRKFILISLKSDCV